VRRCAAGGGGAGAGERLVERCARKSRSGLAPVDGMGVTLATTRQGGRIGAVPVADRRVRRGRVDAAGAVERSGSGLDDVVADGAAEANIGDTWQAKNAYVPGTAIGGRSKRLKACPIEGVSFQARAAQVANSCALVPGVRKTRHFFSGGDATGVVGVWTGAGGRGDAGPPTGAPPGGAAAGPF
jgi:hypothetical protein